MQVVVSEACSPCPKIVLRINVRRFDNHRGLPNMVLHSIVDASRVALVVSTRVSSEILSKGQPGIQSTSTTAVVFRIDQRRVVNGDLVLSTRACAEAELKIIQETQLNTHLTNSPASLWFLLFARFLVVSCIRALYDSTRW